MNQTFTFKSVLIALLVMICCTAKAKTVLYIDNDFIYNIDLETQEASLDKYSGDAKNVVVPENVTYDGKEYKVTRLGNACFAHCFSLVSLVIPSSVTSLGDMCFHWCPSLVSIVIPSLVTSLEDACFSDCSSLVSIDIPSSVTSLGEFCFSGCSSLASIDIPSSVTSIGDDCFSECDSLKTVICRMENVESGNFFYRTPVENATLYVPESLLATYQATDLWSRFGTILPLTEDVELGVGDISKSAVSLHSDNGSVVLSGLADGTPVSYYSVDGRLLGRAFVDNGSASFSVKPNSIVTVKAGKQSFKVCVK